MNPLLFLKHHWLLSIFWTSLARCIFFYFIAKYWFLKVICLFEIFRLHLPTSTFKTSLPILNFWTSLVHYNLFKFFAKNYFFLNLFVYSNFSDFIGPFVLTAVQKNSQLLSSRHKNNFSVGLFKASWSLKTSFCGNILELSKFE